MITDVLGPLGPIIIAGVLGLMLVAGTVVMMLRQPEDPMDKLKRQVQTPGGNVPREKLRQVGHNEQLDRFAGFLNPRTWPS